MQQSDLLRPAEAAALLGLTEHALANDRRRERPFFPYTKLNPRLVRYSRAALQRLIEARTVGGGVQP